MPCVQSRFFSSAPMLLFVLYFLLVFNNSLVSSISFPWYITEYITTGIPSSENWFPNDTEIVDTVVAPNGSVYVLDSNRSLYKFNGYSYSVQKTQLTPPGSPVSSWYGADFDQLFRLWIHPESYDPYLFRLRWSNISAAEDVMCEIVWYTDVDFGNSTTSLPQNVSFSTHIPVTNVSGINRYLDLGREFGSAASLQLAYHQQNTFYLALLDMKGGIHAPTILQEYNNSIAPPPSTTLAGIILECGGQNGLACLVSDNVAESKNFMITPSEIQPISNGRMEWGFWPGQKIQQYRNVAPNLTALMINPKGVIELYHVSQTSSWLKFLYFFPPPGVDLPYEIAAQPGYRDFVLTKNGEGALFARTVITVWNIGIYSYRNTELTSNGAIQLQTMQNEIVSRIALHADDSFTVVGTTWGNFSTPESPTGLLDPSGYAYQTLFFVRFQSINILSQALNFVDIINNIFQVILVLGGVKEADSPSVIATMTSKYGPNMTAGYGIPLWLNETVVRVEFTGIGCGPKILSLDFPGIPSNPSIEVVVTVPPIVTSIFPLSGTVGMSLTVSLRNFYDDSAPAVWVGDFPCSSDTPAIDGIFHCPIPEGGGANLPVIIEHYSVPSFTSFNFSYEPPVVDSISPTTASTEGPITFTIVGSKFGYCGTPFTSPCGSIIYFKLINITIGDRACLRIRHTNTSLSCTVPRGVAGMDLDVVVAYYGQNSSTNSSPKFSSFPPVISKTSKRRILLSSDDPSSSLLEIEGLNLGPPNTKASVIFIANNGTNFPVCNTSVSMNHTWLRCEILRNLPSPHLYNVSVLVAGQYSNSDTQTFYGNFPPIPNPTDITTDEDNVYQVALAGMDSDGDPVEVFLTELPLNGTLYQFDARYPNAKGIPVDFDGGMDGKVIDHLGRVVYAPNPNFCGSDNFSFIVADRVNNVYTNSTPLTVPITVNSIPDPPVVSNIAVSVQEDSNVIINIAITDVDTPLPGVSVVIDTLPGHGEVSYMLDSTASVYITAVPFTIPPGNHSIKYSPRPNYFGADQFAYYVNDGLNDSTIAVVTISVQSVNDKPASLSQSITMMEDQGCTIPFKVDDVDQPATVKQRIKITSWNHTLGNLYQVNSNGLKYGSPLGSNVDVTDNFNRLWFQPNPNEYGTVNLEFTATDELNAVSDSASISITIEPINDAPHILDCKGEILLNSTLKIGPTIIDITSVVKDADVGEQFSFELVEAPQKGKLLLEGNTVDVGTRYLINTSALANGEVPIVLNYQILPQGGGNPFANFTYRLFDNAGVSTELCTVKFTIKCPPPLVNNVFKENSGDICEPCPSGAMCSEDGRYPPYAAPGYWKNENTNGSQNIEGGFLSCSPPSSCASDQMSGCATGYAGVRCGQCSKGYYRLGPNCEKCPDNTGQNVLVFMACIAACCIAVFLLFKFAARGPRLGFVLLLVNFLQTILILNDLKLRWSPVFQTAINSLSFFTLNIELTSPECMATDYEFHFAMKNRIALMVPLLVLLLLGVVPLFGWWRIRVLGLFIKGLFSGGCNIKIGELKQHQRRIWLLCLKVFNMILNIVFVPAASQALELFDCTMEADGNYYLDAEPSSRCYTPKWEESKLYAIELVSNSIMRIDIYFASIVVILS